MAYTAKFDGEERGAFEVPPRTDAYCLECGGRMRVWREAQDGTARHFKHVENMHGGSAVGGGTACSGGESDEHQKWKNFAAERLQEEFSNIAEVTVEKELAAPHTEKQRRFADAALMFEDRDEQLGYGIAVEVQHKNRDKDIESTTRDYIKQDIAVAWVSESDFHDEGCKLNEFDFRYRASEIPSPLYFKEHPVPWDLHCAAHVEPVLLRLQPFENEVPAKIPNEYFDQKAMEIWRDQDWNNLFQPPMTPHHRAQAAIPSVDTTTSMEIPLPREFFNKMRRYWWFNTEIEEMFNTPDYVKQALNGETGRAEAKFPRQWDYKTQYDPVCPQCETRSLSERPSRLRRAYWCHQCSSNIYIDES
jgi:hypothetical protein